MSENARLQKMVEQGGEALNKTAHNNALWAKQNAQAEFKKAYEEGDTDAVVNTQEQMLKAQSEIAEIERYRNNLNTQSQNAQAYQQQAYQQVISMKLF